MNLIRNLLNIIRGESPEQMRERISNSIRQYNRDGIATNWKFQAEK